jgi:hypothetical protein
MFSIASRFALPSGIAGAARRILIGLTGAALSCSLAFGFGLALMTVLMYCTLSSSSVRVRFLEGMAIAVYAKVDGRWE